jgi:VanZ family protein
VTRAPLKHFTWLLAIGWLLILGITVGSLAHLPATGVQVPQGDKVQHLLGYGALSFWFCQLYPGRRDRWIWLLGLFVFGVSMEVAQGTLTAYRSADPQDVIANSTGLLLGFVLAHFWQPLRRWQRLTS